MSNYFKTDQTTLEDFSDSNVEQFYDKGYVFTRLGKGVMNQTRSLRVNLVNFTPSSENRRILNHTSGLEIHHKTLPLLNEYNWEMGKLFKDFYGKKFGAKIASANKAKELMTYANKSNFNSLIEYTFNGVLVGYVIGFETSKIFHYAYPFYEYEKFGNNFGMGMMLKSIIECKNKNLKYFYLGSYTRLEDKYKLQFKGLEWFDGRSWAKDLEALKKSIM